VYRAFALPHLLPGEDEVLVATRCPACGRAHAWNVGRDRPPGGDQVAHFLVPAARMRDDLVRTCGNQRLFCSGSCVSAWLAATGSARGYVMDFGALWRLAAHWYDGPGDPATSGVPLRMRRAMDAALAREVAGRG